jgi:hypothetical protein
MAVVHTLFYLAAPEEAEQIALAEEASDRWPSLWLRHVGDQELVALWGVVGRNAPGSGATVMAELLFQGSDEGPFVMRAPDEFVSAAATVQPPSYGRIAEEWCRAAGLPDWRGRPETIISALDDLCSFARRAMVEKKAMIQVAHL